MTTICGMPQKQATKKQKLCFTRAKLFFFSIDKPQRVYYNECGLNFYWRDER